MMTNYFLSAFRSLTKRGRNHGMKILSLGVGLAMGLVLIAKVFFEQSYDTFYPDADRIYRMNEMIVMNGELKDYGQVSGGVAVGMRQDVAGVQQATRCTWIYVGNVYTDDKKKISINMIAADDSFFNVLPRPMLQGNAEKILSAPRGDRLIMVSKELADKLGGDVVGKILRAEDWGGEVLTIGGVFETIPENATLKYDAVISIDLLRTPDFDGTMNWIGNDRYMAFVKLQPGVSADSLSDAMHAMQEKHQDLEQLKKAGVELSYSLTPLNDLHDSLPEVRRMTWLLLLLAFALVFTAVMNYVLIVVSSLVSRTKEVAVHKCYGASGRDIVRMILSETFLHLILSLLLAVALILAFRATVEELLDASLGALFTTRSLVFLFAICLVVFLTAGLLPGRLFARIPVAAAFRHFSTHRRRWKLALLAVQFMAVGFLLSLLVVITLQYRRMIDDDPGYRYENLAYVSMGGMDSTLRRKLIDEAQRLPELSAVSTFYQPFFMKTSGNNIYLPNDSRELFNIADLYECGNGFLEALEVPIIAGKSFTEDVAWSHEVMVSRRFVDKMKAFADWRDGAVGKQILVMEHSGANNDEPFTICGVYDDIRIGTIHDEDERPSILFYSSDPEESNYLLLKFHHMTPEAMQHVRQELQKLMPDRDVELSDWRAEMAARYADTQRFRNAVMIGVVITLLISLVGLMGYTGDEINRRRKEIAVRKINGATLGEVLHLFERDIIRIAAPALVAGCGAAAYVANLWQTGFSEKISLAWYLFALSGLLLLCVIVVVVALHVRRAAAENPVKSIKSE